MYSIKRPPGKLALLFLCFVVISSCGGLGGEGNSGCEQGFINQSGVPLDILEQQWTTAQTAVSQGVVLNALSVALYGAAPQKTPANPKAMTIGPECVRLVAVPDATVQQLTAYDPRYASYHDPTGLILCDSCSPHVVHSYTYVNSPARVYVAASIASQALEYEFENVILHRLGYDVSQR